MTCERIKLRSVQDFLNEGFAESGLVFLVYRRHGLTEKAAIRKSHPHAEVLKFFQSLSLTSANEFFFVAASYLSSLQDCPPVRL